MKALPISSSPKKVAKRSSPLAATRVTQEKNLVSVATVNKKSSVKPSGKTKTTSPAIKRIKRYTKQGIKSTLLSPVFHVACKVFVVVILVGVTLYGSYRVIGKTFANEVVVSQSEIIARVAKLTPVPQGTPEEIVRVQDAEALRSQNQFYKDVKEGDYILMYSDMAVIYDLRGNQIVAIKRNDTIIPKF